MGLSQSETKVTLPKLELDFRLSGRNRFAPAYKPERWNDHNFLLNKLNKRYPAYLEAYKRKNFNETTAVMANDFLAASDARLAELLELKESFVSTYRKAFMNIMDCTRYRTNCYAYAANWRKGFHPGNKPNPGSLAVKTPINVYNSDDVLQGVLRDGMELFNPSVGIRPYTYLVFLLFHHEDGKMKDYHFVREDDDGTFSHKPGHTSARKTDANRRIIKDPRTANFGNYQLGAVLLCPSRGLAA